MGRHCCSPFWSFFSDPHINFLSRYRNSSKSLFKLRIHCVHASQTFILIIIPKTETQIWVRLPGPSDLSFAAFLYETTRIVFGLLKQIFVLERKAVIYTWEKCALLLLSKRAYILWMRNTLTCFIVGKQTLLNIILK